MVAEIGKSIGLSSDEIKDFLKIKSGFFDGSKVGKDPLVHSKKEEKQNKQFTGTDYHLKRNEIRPIFLGPTARIAHKGIEQVEFLVGASYLTALAPLDRWATLKQIAPMYGVKKYNHLGFSTKLVNTMDKSMLAMFRGNGLSVLRYAIMMFGPSFTRITELAYANQQSGLAQGLEKQMNPMHAAYYTNLTLLTFLTTPLEVLKVRMQLTPDLRNRTTYRNIAELATQMYKKEKWTTFWRGSGAQTFHLFFSAACGLSLSEAFANKHGIKNDLQFGGNHSLIFGTTFFSAYLMNPLDVMKKRIIANGVLGTERKYTEYADMLHEFRTGFFKGRYWAGGVTNSLRIATFVTATAYVFNNGMKVHDDKIEAENAIYKHVGQKYQERVFKQIPDDDVIPKNMKLLDLMLQRKAWIKGEAEDHIPEDFDVPVVEIDESQFNDEVPGKIPGGIMIQKLSDDGEEGIAIGEPEYWTTFGSKDIHKFFRKGEVEDKSDYIEKDRRI